jgi:hypothetical protein
MSEVRPGILSEDPAKKELERFLGLVLTFFNMFDEVGKRLGPEVVLKCSSQSGDL